MVDLHVYWLGVDCRVVGYCSTIGHYILRYKFIDFKYEYLRGRDWLDERTRLIIGDNCLHLLFLLISTTDGTV